MPLITRKSLVWLKPIKVSNGGMGCRHMQVEIFADIDHPFGDNAAILKIIEIKYKLKHN